jgi:hypothetical protein
MFTFAVLLQMLVNLNTLSSTISLSLSDAGLVVSAA